MNGVNGETRAFPVYSFRRSCQLSSRVRLSLISGWTRVGGKKFSRKVEEDRGTRDLGTRDRGTRDSGEGRSRENHAWRAAFGVQWRANALPARPVLCKNAG